MSLRSLPGAVFATFCAAMLGLAAGAVWMLAAVSFGQVMSWLALPAGGLLAVAMRHWVCPGQRAGAAVLAAAATLLAAVYVSVLIAAARIAGSLGIGLVDALRTAGATMLLTLARLGMSPADVAWFLAGAALAAAMALRPRRAAPGR
jgi:vitamin B12 transport system permease protein